MVERERGTGQTTSDEAEFVADPAAFEAATAAPQHMPAEDARHERVMTSARRVMAKHRNVFAALAK